MGATGKDLSGEGEGEVKISAKFLEGKTEIYLYGETDAERALLALVEGWGADVETFRESGDSDIFYYQKPRKVAGVAITLKKKAELMPENPDA